MSMKVANCPKCGRVYVVNTLRDICNVCVKELDLQCESCIKYLRLNKGVDIQELSEATEVPLSLIAKFIREGRISIKGHPNMSYACEVCGANIRDKTICDSCRAKLAKDLSNAKEDEKRASALEQLEKQAAFKISERLKNRD
jgi:flagellar operon protein (TIGR03826 family)